VSQPGNSNKAFLGALGVLAALCDSVVFEELPSIFQNFILKPRPSSIMIESVKTY
jgi:hypothetical protein